MPLDKLNWKNLETFLDLNLTVQLVQDQGYDAVWKKGLVCPNRIVGKNDHNLNCKVCDGLGVLYDGGTATKALITSIGIKQMYQTMGRFDAGMAIISMLPEVKLSWWDKIEIPGSRIEYTEAVVRGVGVVDKLKYRVYTVTRLVLASGVDQIEGTHYEVDVDGKIRWLGTPPGTGIFYSVRYSTHPTYVVLDLLHQIRDLTSRSRGISGSKVKGEFPVQGVGKLSFLIGDESKTES